MPVSQLSKRVNLRSKPSPVNNARPTFPAGDAPIPKRTAKKDKKLPVRG